ncbi:MAG: hypothetical protein Pars92KO_28270 [Parasphingorhabdus sp.]
MRYDQIGHYQRIIKILCEKDRVMKEIVLSLDISSPSPLHPGTPCAKALSNIDSFAGMPAPLRLPLNKFQGSADRPNRQKIKIRDEL